MKKTFKYLSYLLLFPLLLIGLYFFIAYIFTFFPKSSTPKSEQTKKVHLLYSTIHTDIVFDIKDINLSSFPKFKNKKNGYLAFGWGDKETYLNTPNINDIKISTSLKALFINTPSLMHITYIPHISRYKNIKIIKLSSSQKEHLKKSIMKSFSPKRTVHKGYGEEDFFYTAEGKYTAINTCNTWTGNKLRESNVSISYWTPLSSNVISSLP